MELKDYKGKENFSLVSISKNKKLKEELVKATWFLDGYIE